MRAIIFVSLIVLLCVTSRIGFAGPPRPLEGAQSIQSYQVRVEALLEAMAKIESNNNPRAVGQHGEHGLLQIKPEVWQMFTKVSFNRAFEPELNRQIAREYIIYLQHQLRMKLGRNPTVDEVTAAYNGGLARFERRGYRVKLMPKSTVIHVSKVHMYYDSIIKSK